MTKICRFCGQPVKINEDYYDVFEGMHWLCFHLNFEHGNYDPDEPCDDPSCPWNRIGHGYFSDHRICDLIITSSRGEKSIELIFVDMEKERCPSVAMEFRITGDISFKHRKKVWLEKDILTRFLHSLKEIYNTGKGRAILESMSPNQFELVFEHVDSKGHILLLYTYNHFEYLRETGIQSTIKDGFEIEIQSLESIINSFERLYQRMDR